MPSKAVAQSLTADVLLGEQIKHGVFTPLVSTAGGMEREVLHKKPCQYHYDSAEKTTPLPSCDGWLRCRLS